MSSLTKIAKRLYNFVFIKHYWIFLLIVVLAAYGQMLGFGAWKDDNAIFFKFDHIYENAGFFGKGILGVGPYRFSITPYYPIFKIFGNTSFVPYYLLILVFYYLSTLGVYYLFSTLFSKKLGRISAFLFAAGFVASEGFYWLANAMLADVGIIIIVLGLLFYALFARKRNLLFYFLALFVYWVSAALVPLRTHFAILVVILFEFLYLTFKKLPKSLFGSLIRISPFLYIFYRYFIHNADARAGNLSLYVIALVKGDFSKLFSFLSGISNLFVSDILLERVLPVIRFPSLILFVIPIILFILFKKLKGRIWLTVAFSALSVIWYFGSKNIFTTPVLTLSSLNFFILFLGGEIILFLLALFLIFDGEKRKLLVLFSFWLFAGIGSYAAYEPAAFFNTTHRYLTNSFFALTGVLGLLYLYFKERGEIFGKIGSSLIIIWGVFNFGASIYHLNNLYRQRSLPVLRFYQSLKTYLPTIKKGDLIYFDVADEAQKYFADAFSVSSMPETTAIAWRYGIDRYDFYRVTDFSDLLQIKKEKSVPLNQIYTFFYQKSGLVNTTEKTRSLLAANSSQTLFTGESVSKEGEIILDLNPTAESVVPRQFELALTASYDSPDSLKLPLQVGSPIAENQMLMALNYGKAKSAYYQTASVSTSSDWQNRVTANLIDGNLATVWQADRLKWLKEKKAEIVIDLKKTERLSGLVWANGMPNNTPTAYTVSVSNNKIDWQKVASGGETKKLEAGQLTVVNFLPQSARFVKMTITSSIVSDSPSVAEVWVVPADFGSLDVAAAERFLISPFMFVDNVVAYSEGLKVLNFVGKVKYAWQNNKYSSWQTTDNSYINVVYDGRRRNYQIALPAGGTQISQIRLYDLQIPGTLTVYSGKVK